MAADPNADAIVRQMRDAIIDTDLKLLQAINARIQLVARLRAYKRSQGIDFVDQAREDWMHSYLQGANRGPLSAEVSKITVTELRETTFYAMITLRGGAAEIVIDSRPSDALALAVRSNAPIFAADKVIEESGIEFEHEVEETDEVVEKFKEFLDQVSPEDFMTEG